MTEYKPRYIGTLYTVSIDGSILPHKNGKPKTFSNWSKADKTAQKLGVGAKVVPIDLSVPEPINPIEIDPDKVAEMLRTVANTFDTGIPVTAICELSTSHESNVVRFYPLGSKRVVQEGDEDIVQELHLKWRCDVARIREANSVTNPC